MKSQQQQATTLAGRIGTLTTIAAALIRDLAPQR